MSVKIVRKRITEMTADAIVCPAESKPVKGDGIDMEICDAAGSDRLLWFRRENIGEVNEGEVFVTPAFDLPCKMVIHAVCPLFRDGTFNEERNLRNCYRKALETAFENKARSIVFPLLSTGNKRYPREESLRVAIDEINAFLSDNQMDVFISVFDEKLENRFKRLSAELDEYIEELYDVDSDETEISFKEKKGTPWISEDLFIDRASTRLVAENYGLNEKEEGNRPTKKSRRKIGLSGFLSEKRINPSSVRKPSFREECEPCEDIYDEIPDELKKRMMHLSDTFSQYLMFLIESKGMKNAEVYKRAIVDKKVFSKIKNNPEAHPKKNTAMRLCVGAKLNLDETKDLLARAGYALSPCDKTDIIFSFFIEKNIYDMILIDIVLEEEGLECIID
ncbi:MAG: macro domain-containing protein [Lachnospiraceae bacterium]|nr:macro domain-containing protein [Lachnospiraceae bacterium]